MLGGTAIAFHKRLWRERRLGASHDGDGDDRRRLPTPDTHIGYLCSESFVRCGYVSDRLALNRGLKALVLLFLVS